MCVASGSRVLGPCPVQPLQVCNRQGDRPELLLHLTPKNEGPLVEQDVTTLAVDLGKEYRLDQAVAIIEGRKLHRLILGGVYRLGRGEHTGSQDVLPDMPVQLGARAKAELPKPAGVELHRVRVGDESKGLIFFPATALGGVFLEGWDGRRQISG